METYSIDNVTFIVDGWGGEIDVEVNGNYHTSIPIAVGHPELSRQAFISECEAWFASEMVWC